LRNIKVLVVAPAIIVLFRYHSKTGTALVVAITVFVSPSFIIVVAETFKELVNGTSKVIGVELQLPKSTFTEYCPAVLV
jgi:hypothetical protein